MITYEEYIKYTITLIIFIIIMKQVIKMILESKELKYNNLSISKINKDVNKRIKKENRKCQKK